MVVNETFEPTLVGVVADELSDGPAVIDGAVLKTQPVLLPPSVELVPAFQVAPPAAAE